MLHNHRHSSNEIVLISSAESFHPDGYKVGVGDHVQLNSGGPAAVVVDILPRDMVCISWRDGATVHEQQLPMRCVHQI